MIILTAQLLPQYWVKRSSIDITASDDWYYLGNGAESIELDEEDKLLRYYDYDGVERTLNYGDL